MTRVRPRVGPKFAQVVPITKSVSPIVAGKWSASPAKQMLDQRDIDETENRGG
jgi:hypothetical protein